jgi:ubiquinone/menaquinone biosynthesis C-methylase UbiE
MEQVALASLHFFEAAYPLQRLASSTLIIDVAGGIGIASIFLAEKLPKQRFLITDYQSVIEQGKAKCPAHLRARVQYVAHDMFEPYHNLGFETNSERVFLLKQILHDWSDDQCVTILSNILDCFGPSDRLLIIDSVKPVEGTGLSTAMSEIMVMSTFGGRHRNYAEFQTLVCAARSNALVQTSFANAGQYDDFLVLEVRVGDSER